MLRFSLAALAAIVFVSAAACGSRNSSVSPHVLAAADPASAEAPFSPPVSVKEDVPPRTLGLEIADPARMKQPETPPEIGTPHDHGAEDHSQHGAPSPAATPTPTSTPKPAAPPKPTPKPAATATPQKAETVYACPMHPEVRDTKPGTCPKCGMQLEPVAPPPSSPRPAASPSPAGTPAPGGHEHQHGSTS